MRFAEYAGFAVVCLGIGAAHAKAGLPNQDHDGVYAIHAVTQHGSCHKAYNTKVTVSGGQIRAAGHARVRGSGHISVDGRVLATIRVLHHTVHVTGRVQGDSGSGKWSSQGLHCGGTWRATRQG
jgi:uncharacterized protein with beta-barrel porin domain